MRRHGLCIWLIAFAVLGMFQACTSEGIQGTRLENQPPRVWLSAAPPEGTVEKYRVHLYWGGWDPDGEILRYEFLTTNNTTGVFNPADTVGKPWTPVLANDSTIVFSADNLADPRPTSQISEFRRSHTFFIRAVDEEGLRSTRPAYRSFTSRTLSPSVNIMIPVGTPGVTTPADVPPIITFSWLASDYVSDRLVAQEPDSVQWALVSTKPFASAQRPLDATIAYLRSGSPASQKEWYPWVFYRAENDSGKFWTSPPQEYGTYIFAMRAKDEAGAVTPVLDEAFNVRRLRVGSRITGPLLTVANVYMGATATTTCSTPLTVLDVPAGVTLNFSFAADAKDYGGIVSGYRFGWDISDLTDPEQWEVDWTPFVQSVASTTPRTFFFGTHTLTVEVVDNSGFCSRVEIKVNVIQFTLERDVLIVDDFKPDEQPASDPGWGNGRGRGVLPNDAEHDAFWVDMVSNVKGFDLASDVISLSKAGEVPLALLARYKAIIWSVYADVGQEADFPLLYSYIQYRSQRTTSGGGPLSGKVQPNYLALSMAAGVHLMLAGQHPVQLVENRDLASPRHPLIVRYEMEGQDLQTGSDGPDVSDPMGEISFAYRELCVDVIDYGYMFSSRRRYRQSGAQFYCSVEQYRDPYDLTSLRDDTMRGANPLDLNFPPLELRDEITEPGMFYQPSDRGLDAEVYNPSYFRSGKACQYVSNPRNCFQPIYGMISLDTQEPTYNEPVAFWTSAFADRVADVPGAIGARSVVFGFPPVYFKPNQVKPAMEYIFFNEWQLPRVPGSATASTSP